MAFSDPKQNIQELRLREGMHVADFGAGSGHYSRLAAERVGDSGVVYAVDVQTELLRSIKREAQEARRENIEVIPGDVSLLGGVPLADASMDAVIFSNILFQLPDKSGAIQEAHRVLTEKGLVHLIEWTDSYGGIGPKPESVFSSERAKELFANEGFVPSREFPAGEHHYGITFEKKK